MNTYVVWRQGVYMQGIVGVFDDLEKAKDAALLACYREDDDYHTFHVGKNQLNVPTKSDDCSDYDIPEILKIKRIDHTRRVELKFEEEYPSIRPGLLTFRNPQYKTVVDFIEIKIKRGNA